MDWLNHAIHSVADTKAQKVLRAERDAYNEQERLVDAEGLKVAQERVACLILDEELQAARNALLRDVICTQKKALPVRESFMLDLSTPT